MGGYAGDVDGAGGGGGRTRRTREREEAKRERQRGPDVGGKSSKPKGGCGMTRKGSVTAVTLIQKMVSSLID